MKDTTQMIIDLIEDSNMTTKAIAVKAGLKPETVYRILRRETGARLSTAELILDALGYRFKTVKK